MLHGLRRRLRLYIAFWRACIAREAEFRGNFWANVVVNFGWLIFFFVFVKIIFRNTDRVGSWTEGEMMLLTAVFTWIYGIFNITVFENLALLPQLVRLGTFDFVLIRPVGSQFQSSLQRVKLDRMGNTLGAIPVAVYGFSLLGRGPDFLDVLASAWLGLCALMLLYSFAVMSMTLSFWLVRIDNLVFLTDTLFYVGRYPIDIFGGFMRTLLTYVVPIAFVASFPTQLLLGRGEIWWLGAGTALAVVFFTGSMAFWQWGLRFYGSASS